MIRGTTAQFKFKLPYPASELLWVTIKIWQQNNTNPYLPIIKKLENCAVSDVSEICVSLTAEETQRFSEKSKAKVQLRAQHANSGTIFGSRPQLVTVYPMDEGILDDEEVFVPPVNSSGLVILDGGPIKD